MRHLLFIATLSMICSASIAAQQIYRWVDDQGITHFGAQPPDDAKAVRIEAKAPCPGSFVPPTGKTTNSLANDPEQQELDMQVKNQVMEEEAERTKFCEQTRTNLAQLRNNPRLRYTDDAGQTHMVTEDIRQQRILEAEQSIKDFCL